MIVKINTITNDNYTAMPLESLYESGSLLHNQE